jgi:hypothetical protein
MQYCVVEANSASALEQEVQTRLDEGWEPLGGVAVATYAAGAWWYYQALVRSERRWSPPRLERE